VKLPEMKLSSGTRGEEGDRRQRRQRMLPKLQATAAPVPQPSTSVYSCRTQIRAIRIIRKHKLDFLVWYLFISEHCNTALSYNGTHSSTSTVASSLEASRSRNSHASAQFGTVRSVGRCPCRAGSCECLIMSKQTRYS
jgi:hypothetical protein